MFGNVFSSSEEEVENPDLLDLDVGWHVDFEFETYEVKEVVRNTYDGSFESREWRLENTNGKTFFLEWEDYDGGNWIFMEEGSFDNLGSHSKKSITTFPDLIEYNGKSFSLLEYGNAVRNNKTRGNEETFKYADYEAPDGTLLAVESYGNGEVELWEGEEVGEYQFENVLPND